MVISKLVVGALGLAFLSTSGIIYFVYEGFGKSDVFEEEKTKEYTELTPTPHPTKTWKSQSSQNSALQFGGKYKPFLVSTTDNDDWWNNKWNEFEKSKPLSGAFSDVSDANSLKNKCKEAYDKPFSRDGNKNGFQTNEKFTISDVFKYCSGLNGIPKKLTDGEVSSYSHNSLAKDRAYNYNFVSVNEGDNDEYWAAKNDEFYEKDNLKRPIIRNISEDIHFSKGRANNKTIRELCKEAYNKDKFINQSGVSDSVPNNSLSTYTEKYCGFEYIDS